jgi:GR25 family glycosyltransferase involved in LPS biosynthesis
MNNPFDFFDKIYYINLDSRPDRREETEKELSKYGIKAERWPATRISEEHNNFLTEIGFPLCEQVSDDDPYHRDRIKKVSLGQRSCTISHLNIVKHAKENKFKNVFIFEDDIVFNREVDVLGKLSKMLTDLKDKEWDMLNLGGILQTTPIRITDNLFRLGYHLCTHSVAFNSTGYNLALNFPFLNLLTVDDYYSKQSGLGNLKAFTPNVPLVFQKESFSDIQMWDVGEIGWTVKERYEKMIGKR